DTDVTARFPSRSGGRARERCPATIELERVGGVLFRDARVASDVIEDAVVASDGGARTNGGRQRGERCPSTVGEQDVVVGNLDGCRDAAAEDVDRSSRIDDGASL